MKNFFFAIGLLSALALASSLSPVVNVAVTLQPYAKIVEEIGGTRVSVITMVPPNADPHSFEPKPAILKTFSKADLYFSDSSGLDQVWLPRFLSANKKIEVVYISTGISWMHHDDHDHHHHDADHHQHDASLDPHIWTSPKQVQKLAQNIFKALVKKDPSSKSYYESQLYAFIEKWSALDQFMEGVVAQLPKNRRTFIVFHPSYGYLARDYGLVQKTIEVEGKEPKPRDLKKLIAEAKKDDIHVVFVQPQFSKRSAEAVAAELKAVVVSTSPLDFNIEKNLREFMQALLDAAKK
ncbi:MAG TPA: zinc ABC transporter solute-binding protein [Fibrobacter sp.]|nr:zinc ABC transporter solute-binding protein [Fibrobacter sp.]